MRAQATLFLAQIYKNTMRYNYNYRNNAGDYAPYDVAALHQERQALRDQINALEGEP